MTWDHYLPVNISSRIISFLKLDYMVRHYFQRNYIICVPSLSIDNGSWFWPALRYVTSLPAAVTHLISQNSGALAISIVSDHFWGNIYPEFFQLVNHCSAVNCDKCTVSSRTVLLLYMCYTYRWLEYISLMISIMFTLVLSISKHKSQCTLTRIVGRLHLSWEQSTGRFSPGSGTQRCAQCHSTQNVRNLQWSHYCAYKLPGCLCMEYHIPHLVTYERWGHFHILPIIPPYLSHMGYTPIGFA